MTRLSVWWRGLSIFGKALAVILVLVVLSALGNTGQEPAATPMPITAADPTLPPAKPTTRTPTSPPLAPTATPKPTATPTPITYEALTAREWAQVVKAPDSYTGEHYKLWGCITQFDAATGLDSFRAQASYRNETYWFPDGENALFTGDAGELAEFVTGDVLLMNVDVVGSFTYDTQVGGSTTAPLFRVVAVPQSKPGAC